MAAPVIALERVSKSYGGEAVLRDVNLLVEAGESVAIVGRSGSGKSTLLHVAGGLDRRYTGSARVLGSDLATLSDVEIARFRNAQVGFVFQAFHLLEHLSCVENVALPWLFSSDTTDPVARAVAALERVGMAERAYELPSRLSGGQKQRVSIARALFHAPPLLLADEPTGNLDSETGKQIIALFEELHAGGLTLVIVTHEERVSRSARRVVRIEDGHIVDGEAA